MCIFVLLSEIDGAKEIIFGFIKFTSHVESLLSGVVYMNNLKTYIDMEKDTGIQGMGDRLEASHVISEVDIEITISGSSQVVHNGKANQISYRFDEDELKPVYCLFAIHAGNLQIIDEDDQYFYTSLSLSNTQIKSLIENFGNELVFIYAGAFLGRLEAEIKSKQFDYMKGIVKYADFEVNQSERMLDYENRNVFFWKGKSFEYQHEYRIVLTSETTIDGLPIKIGDISDISASFNAEYFFKNIVIHIKKSTLKNNEI